MNLVPLGRCLDTLLRLAVWNSRVCACVCVLSPPVVRAASAAGAGRGGPAGAAGGAAQGAGGPREPGAHHQPPPAADGPVRRGWGQPLAPAHPLHGTPQRPLPALLLLFLFFGGPSGWPEVTGTSPPPSTAPPSTFTHRPPHQPYFSPSHPPTPQTRDFPPSTPPPPHAAFSFFFFLARAPPVVFSAGPTFVFVI